MNCTHESVGQLGLDSIVEAASAIYEKHDKNRSLWDVWSHAVHHAAAIAEEIRKCSQPEFDDKKLKQEVADFTLWLITMLAKLKGPLGSPIPNQPPQDWIVRISVGASDLIWNRYPGVCPWCYCEAHQDSSLRIDDADFGQPCCCNSLRTIGREKEKEELRARAKRTRWLAIEHTSRRPKSIDGWQEMIGSLYGERLNQASLQEVALHLFEEIGEVSDCLIRMYTYVEKDWDHIADEISARQIRLEDELADVLSWLFGLVERLDIEGRSRQHENSSTVATTNSKGKMLLSQILWARYGCDEKNYFRCWACKGAICSCLLRPIKTENQVADLLSRFPSSPSADFPQQL